MMTTLIVSHPTNTVRPLALPGVWMRNHISRKSLRHLTPEQLADVGLTIAQAQSEGGKWFWQ